MRFGYLIFLFFSFTSAFGMNTSYSNPPITQIDTPPPRTVRIFIEKSREISHYSVCEEDTIQTIISTPSLQVSKYVYFLNGKLIIHYSGNDKLTNRLFSADEARTTFEHMKILNDLAEEPTLPTDYPDPASPA